MAGPSMEMDEQTKIRPLATLSWVSIETSDLNLDDSAVFRNSEISSEVHRKRFQFFNRAFPIYIPIEHHKMSVRELVSSFPKGQYWAAAIYFLLTNKAFGPFVHRPLEEGETSESPADKLLFLSFPPDNLMKELFPAGVPQCQNITSFILEPRLLVQLLVEPSVLHQWLVAVLAETIKLETEMTELYAFPTSPKLSPFVLNLDKLLKAAKEAIAEGFDLLERNFADNFYDGFRVEEIYDKISPFLEFWSKSDGLKVVRSLTKLCLSGTPMEITHTNKQKMHELTIAKRNYVYNLDYWRQSKELTGVFGDTMAKPAKSEPILKDSERVALLHDYYLSPDFTENIDVTSVRDELKDKLQNDQEFAQCVLDMRTRKTVLSQLQIQKVDHGILNTIFYLTAEMEARKAKAAVCNYLQKITKKPPSTFFINKDMDEIHVEDEVGEYDLIVNFFLKQSLNWNQSHENHRPTYLTQLAYDITGVHCDYTVCPTHIQVANILESRIKSLVSKRIMKCEFADSQIVQYLLPCFVVSFLEFCSKETAKDDIKNWYGDLINKVITEYEWATPQIEQSILENNFVLKYTFSRNSSVLLLNYFKNIVMPLEIYVGNSFCVRLFQLLFSFLESKDVIDENDLRLKSHVTWIRLIWVFFERIRLALSVNIPTVPSLSDAEPVVASQKVQNMLTFCRLICKESGFPASDCFANPGLKCINVLFYTWEICRFKCKKANIADKIRNEVTNLSEKQVLSVVLYSILKHAKIEDRKAEFNSSRFVGLPMVRAFAQFLTHGVTPSLREFVANCHGSSFRVSFEFAKRKAPNVYAVPLAEIIISRKKVDDHLRSNLWCFPIVHCRTCGTIHAEEGFLTCDECKEKSFPDTHFCSSYCMVQALHSGHRMQHDEHTYYLAKKLLEGVVIEF